MISREACRGCRDDFYNQPGNTFSGDRCWMAEDGTMMTRYEIGISTMPATPGAYTQVKKPSCYRRSGVVYHNRLPDFVKVGDVINYKRARRTASDPT